MEAIQRDFFRPDEADPQPDPRGGRSPLGARRSLPL
jgi:hypothetical protein